MLKRVVVNETPVSTMTPELRDRYLEVVTRQASLSDRVITQEQIQSNGKLDYAFLFILAAQSATLIMVAYLIFWKLHG